MVGQTLGHYRIEEQIGAGGMGVVYRAHDRHLNRNVALKLLPEHSLGHPVAHERLHKEALALSKLNHPNIAQVYDFDTQDGVAFLIMEHVSGDTLARKLKHGPLAEEVVINLGLQVSSALQAAAAAGVVHRDIKPSNIMLTSKDEVKVLDFGLAKLFHGNENDLTQSGEDLREAAGTLPYMPPEQLRCERVDCRSDIYSLGSVMYEAATGWRPFSSPNSAQLISEILNKRPNFPRALNSGLSVGFENTVMRCLAKDPAHRYQTPSELRAALESIQDSRNVNRSSGLTRGFGLKMAFAILVLTLAMVGASIASWRAYRRAPTIDVSRPNELAVLPINMIGNDGSVSAFNSGLVETLTSRLAQLSKNHSLQVVPASEVRAKGVTNLGEATQQFGATLGLNLSIERSGQMIRVNYALIDAKSHKQLSGDTITAPASDPFGLEDRVADSLVKSLVIELQPQEQRTFIAHGTTQPAAYDYYLQGRGYLQDYQKRENIDSAITVFNHALEKDPRYSVAFAGLGEAYWRRYELSQENSWAKQAQVACEKAIALDAGQAESHSCLGMVYNGTGKYDDAVREYQQAVEFSPTNDDAIRGLASAFASLGRMQDAEKTYLAAISTRPQYWRGYNSLGALYVTNGRYSEAAEMFSRVIALAPDSFRGYSNLGAVYIRLGRSEDAAKLLQASIKIRPTADAYSNLGTAFYHMRRFDEAAINYLEAVKLNDQDYVVWGNLADAYHYSGIRHSDASSAYEKAISLAKLRLEVNPHDSSVLGDIAGYNSMLNRRRESLAFLNRALQQAGTSDPDLFFNAAMIYNQLGETNVALDWLERALTAGYSPSTAANAPALDNLHANLQFQRLLRDRTAPKN
jgi:serine/threonine protein kinase/tetratricopeptide (TPR) repeat protein